MAASSRGEEEASEDMSEGVGMGSQCRELADGPQRRQMSFVLGSTATWLTLGSGQAALRPEGWWGSPVYLRLEMGNC